MYLGEIKVSFVFAALLIWQMNHKDTINGSYNRDDCSEELAPITFTLATIVAIKLILSLVAIIWMVCSNNVLNDDADVYRVMLSRLEVQVFTVKHKIILTLLLICDVFTVIAAIICIPVMPVAKESCSVLYNLSLFMLFGYQIVVLIRVPCLLCIFLCGQRFWSCCKRLSCCACLNIVEGEQTAEFEVYEANDYIERVNISSNQGDKMELNELICAICLTSFQDIAGTDNGHIVALSCNMRHTFHSPCLEQWLKHSPECPLCKQSVFKTK